MRVLIVHNAYRNRGGEDSVADAERALLANRGHEVALYCRHNDDVDESSRLGLLLDTLWSRRTVREAGAAIGGFRPDVIHVHNTFPLISPALYWTATRLGVPVVQTLHNFRLICPQAMLLRRGRVCEACLGRLPWRGVARRCYRGSTAQSAALAGMVALHRAMGTYRKKVARYIALNEFCRGKFVAGGLPADRIAVKPNFVDLPRETEGARAGGIFVGRLSPEKGIDVLLGALSQGAGPAMRVVGTGPEAGKLAGHPAVAALGWLSQAETLAEMRRAAYLVMPSMWYENFPRTLVEAFACGLPVIGSRLGAMAELIEDGRTGLLFRPGSAEDLAAKRAWADSHPREMRRMGEAARREYEAKYTADMNYKMLVDIYEEAIGDRADGG